jgi:hypothetical protein
MRRYMALVRAALIRVKWAAVECIFIFAVVELTTSKGEVVWKARHL